MNFKGVRWLYAELPLLIQRGVLSAEDAERIRAHYGPVPEVSRAKLSRIVLSVAGATLVGLGVLQVIAHNWDNLPQEARVALAFLPLVVGLALVGWTIWARYGSVAWRELSAILCMAGFGGCLALISQVYHLYPDLRGFLMWWTLAAIPLILLLNSTSAAVAVAALVTTWACLTYDSARHYAGYALLMSPILLHLGLALWKRRQHPRAIILLWVLPVSFFAFTVSSVVMQDRLDFIWAPLFGCLFSVYVLSGSLFLKDREKQPLLTFGLAGLSVVLLIASTQGVWHVYRMHRWGAPLFGLSYTTALFALAAVLLGLAFWRRLPLPVLLWGASFMPVAAAYAFVRMGLREDALYAPIAINIYIVAVSITTLAEGLRRNRLLFVNGGLALLSVLVAIHFFGQEFDYIARGIAFVMVGAVFLAMNLFMFRRRAETREETA